MSSSAQSALRDLRELTALGPRFHGGAGIAAAEQWLVDRIEAVGASVRRQEVRTAGWEPGRPAAATVIAPVERALVVWPMLWSPASPGEVIAELRPVGLQGLWGDAMVWTKFAAVVDDAVVAYVHARDDGPAAPQPLPVGSDLHVPHFAIGRIDGLAIAEWLGDGHVVRMRLEAHSQARGEAVSRSLLVDLPLDHVGDDRRRVVLCGHYDTFWNTPGAYDNGSGTIALLHLVEAAFREWGPRRPVTVAFFTAEEWHLAGSRAFVDRLSVQERDDIGYVVNLDGLGRGDFLEMFAGPEAFEADVFAALSVAASRGRPALRVQSRFPPTCGTDHASFYAAGIPAVHFTFNDLHRLHQPDDVPNEGIAENIAWTTAVVQELVEELPIPARHPGPQLPLPF